MRNDGRRNAMSMGRATLDRGCVAAASRPRIAAFAPHLVAAVLIARSAVPAIALGAGSLEVAYTPDRVSGRASDVPRARVVSEMCTKAGVEVVGTVVDPDETVSLEFGGDTLERELERLLQRQSYSLRYADTGRLRAIHLHGRIAEAPIGSPPPPAVPPVPSRPPDLPTDLVQAVRDHPPIMLDEPLRSILGTPSASIASLYTVAAQNPSPEARAAALQAIARVVESDPRLRAALAGAGGALRGFVAATGGQSTDRILDGLATMPGAAASSTP
jgi:hypothetical protein